MCSNVISTILYYITYSIIVLCLCYINSILCTVIRLVIFKDLCQHTPENHPDFSVLKQSLNVMSDFIASTHDPRAFQQVRGISDILTVIYLSLPLHS